MKYNQNRKIKQITESTLGIGVDIATERHVARAQDSRGIEFSNPLPIENSRQGFDRFHLIPTGIYAELRNGMNLRDRLQEDLQYSGDKTDDGR